MSDACEPLVGCAPRARRTRKHRIAVALCAASLGLAAALGFAGSAHACDEVRDPFALFEVPRGAEANGVYTAVSDDGRLRVVFEMIRQQGEPGSGGAGRAWVLERGGTDAGVDADARGDADASVNAGLSADASARAGRAQTYDLRNRVEVMISLPATLARPGSPTVFDTFARIGIARAEDGCEADVVLASEGVARPGLAALISDEVSETAFEGAVAMFAEDGEEGGALASSEEEGVSTPPDTEEPVALDHAAFGPTGKTRPEPFADGFDPAADLAGLYLVEAEFNERVRIVFTLFPIGSDVGPSAGAGPGPDATAGPGRAWRGEAFWLRGPRQEEERRDEERPGESRAAATAPEWSFRSFGGIHAIVESDGITAFLTLPLQDEPVTNNGYAELRLEDQFGEGDVRARVIREGEPFFGTVRFLTGTTDSVTFDDAAGMLEATGTVPEGWRPTPE